MNLKQLLQLLPEDEHVYITGHVHPDGDCVGAALSLYNVLIKYRTVQIVLEDKVADYNYLSGFNKIIDYTELEARKEKLFQSKYSFIVVDSGDTTRIQPIIDVFNNASRTINIDHHESNTNFGDFNYVDTKSSSTCEMIGTLIGLLNESSSELTKEVAECLYTGIIYDTGVFKHSNTRKETHKIASMLVDSGIDFTWMINKMYFTKSTKNIKALSIALNNLELVNNKTVAMTVLTYDDLEDNQLRKSDTESIVNVLNEIEGPYASAFLLEVSKGEFKGSLRSSSLLNVCNVAKAFGGGGHIKAAGCTIYGTLNHVKEEILKELHLEYQRNH